VGRCLRDEYVPFLQGNGTAINTAWFQQAGARPHTSTAILQPLHDVFKDRVLSNW